MARKAQYTESLTVAFSPEIYSKIKNITNQKEISMADLVREIIQKELNVDNSKSATLSNRE